MCLLGLETSADLCSVAIAREGVVIAKKSLHMPYGQAGHLMGLIQEVMDGSRVTWKDLTGVAVNRGPGSFTGIRGGMAVAQGIGLAGDLPVLGLTGFEIYRTLSNIEDDLLVLMDTRREDCFASFFKSHSLDPEFSKVMSYEEVGLFCKNRSVESSSSVQILKNINPAVSISNNPVRILDAADLLGAVCFYQEKQPDVFSSEPYYLREPEIHGHPTVI